MASAADTDLVRELFREYAASLGVSVAYQGFAEELSALPGKYAPPAGGIWLARAASSSACGCVALRPLSAGIAELKRLYVRPEARGLGAGRALLQTALAAAHTAGYKAVRLDSLPSMASALRLYASLGFQPIPPYCDNPFPGAVFLERRCEPDC